MSEFIEDLIDDNGEVEDAESQFAAVQSLSHFEKAKVLTLLLKKDEAIDACNAAIAETNDPEKRGEIFVHLANLYYVDDPKKSEELLIKAIEVERSVEARVSLALLYLDKGDVQKAIDLLIVGIKNKEAKCVPALICAYANTIDDPDQIEDLAMQVLATAGHNGLKAEQVNAEFAHYRVKLLGVFRGKTLDLTTIFKEDATSTVEQEELRRAIN